jgi:hypothetical protein
MNQSKSMPSGVHNTDLHDTTGAQSILNQIHKGMAVYDVRDNNIGHVDFVHFGAASETQQELGVGPATTTRADNPNMRNESIITNIAEAFHPNEVPQELQSRLLVSGYIRLDTGLFGSDRFVTPEQIVAVSGDKVQLSVNKDQLTKRQ